MKIAILSFYSGAVYRGVETFVHEVANRLSDKGHLVTVYQSAPKLPGSNYEVQTIDVAMNFDRASNNLLLGTYNIAKVTQHACKALRKIDKDTDILMATNGRLSTFIARFWTINKKTKLVISGQSGPGFDDRLNLYTFPDAFVALTNYQASWAKAVNSKVKVYKIPNGVDIDKFSEFGNKLKLGVERPIILNVSALEPMKRLDLAIRAVSKLEKGSLVLVGKGIEKERLTKLGKVLLPNRFKILSFPYDQMPEVYRSADLFTFCTSPQESFGIVIAEAMASGLPVVVSDDPIRQEIVGNAGFFVDPMDSDSYSNALKSVLQTKWGNKPRKQAEKFNWDRVAGKYEQLFQLLTDKKGVDNKFGSELFE